MAAPSSSTPSCPICEQAIRLDAEPPPALPFCSQRCKLVDLSRWLSEDYRVSGPPTDDFALLGIEDLEGFDLD